MKLLAFDTATEACTAAVWLDGNVRERFELGTRHAERLLPMVDELLAESGLTLAGLDAVAFGRGPGSFTGLRIGAGIAQGLAFGADLPVIPISSLAALAQGVDGPRILAAFDARMQQVYWGAFVRGGDGLIGPADNERVCGPADVPLPEGQGWTGAGSGWDQYSEALRSRLGGRLSDWRPQTHPHARDLAVLAAAAFDRGRAVPAEQALPVYLRDNVAIKPKAG
jgi:tRNA threonylcarbamoyladenosine biosynthesis protein TsaB